MKRGYLIFLILLMIIFACNVTRTQKEAIQILELNVDGKGNKLEIEFVKGSEFNYPTFAFWIEDLEGNYLQTLYVTRSLATGTYKYAALSPGKWSSTLGEARRPATLPYWLHKRGVIAADETFLPTPGNPIPDAYTGATPKANFKIYARTDVNLPSKFRLLMEINQPWDWNEFWNNSIHLDDENYKTSCQPALVYSVTIDTNASTEEYFLNTIGHSHYAGGNGELYTDLSTITTARNIVKKVIVKFKKD